MNCQRQGSPSGVLSAPRRRRAAPLLGRGRSERRPSPGPRDTTSVGRGGARGMLGLVVGPPLLRLRTRPPSSILLPPAKARTRGVASAPHRAARDQLPCNPTGRHPSLQDEHRL